jgi:carbohydrate kinase (thermoresistant glucokinase family)
MTSFRPRDDKAWNYVRESPKLTPFLRWVPRGPRLFECTVLPGWPAKVASNQPDGSYATKDLFEPHPTIEKAWKYIARLDDTVVLVNGEKFNPVMMEGKIRSHKAVTETVIFGSARPHLGALIVSSPSVHGLSSTQIVDQIWPVIEEANRTAEAYARLSRDMIHILPHDCEFPRTDKGSVIRQAFYKAFAADIENAYDQAAAVNGGLKLLTIPELEAFLYDTLIKILPEAKDADRTTDFFSMGLDSLQSIQVRTAILKTVDIGNNKLGQNVVFDYPCIESLSAYLYGLPTGASEAFGSVSSKMQDFINKYSDFQLASRGGAVLTGATGSLGAHVLAQLIARPEIETVHCLVRARDAQDATRRVQKSLMQRKIYHSLSLAARRKIHALPSDLSSPCLGLDSTTYQAVAQNLATVIHCAWSVNFNFNLSTFEKDCISGVRHLVDLCHAVPSSKPASFDFCSSVSTVARCPDLHTPEIIAELDWAQDMGYAQSKCVAEHICMAAVKATGIRARILRVGQIVADTTHGVWNDTEAIPLIIQSALTIGALPKLQESPSWTPVDVVAQAVAEIALSDSKSTVANVTNAKTFSWIDDLLPVLREAGLEFDEVEPKEWVRRLSLSSDDVVTNPPKKLLGFFASKYDKDTFAPSRTYETSVARSLSLALANAPVLDPAFVKTFVDRFRSSAWAHQSASSRIWPKKHIVVLAGPCGSGKSTIAKQLSANFGAPFIEGDEIHSPEAVSQMANGTPLDDLARTPWLDRLKEQALLHVTEFGHDIVLVSCSALKQAYRDRFRELERGDESVKVMFLDLQVEEGELLRRMTERGDHYMKADMVTSQLAIRQDPGAFETDVLPVDAGKTVQEIVEEVTALLPFASDTI